MRHSGPVTPVTDTETYRYSRPAQPLTPNKKRKLAGEKTESNTEPITPTPAAVGMMAHSYSSGDIDDVPPTPGQRRTKRPAQPHMTNALLRTPKGSRVAAKTQVPLTDITVHDAAALDTGAETTTQNLLEIAEAHICKVDPKLQQVIDQNHCHVFSPEGLAEEVDPFRSLVSGILAQQVSGAAANAIKNKFIGLFNENSEGTMKFPAPEQVAKTDIARMRTAGLSQRKAEYVQGLAEKFANGELSAQMLANASDEEVLEKLVAVRGLGVWSVEMFMCFALKRMDILSTGDLGVQ